MTRHYNHALLAGILVAGLIAAGAASAPSAVSEAQARQRLHPEIGGASR